MVRGSNPGGGEIFHTCPDRSWVPSSLLYNVYRVFPGGKERLGRDADPSPLLVPSSRKSRAVPLLPLWVERLVQSLSACTGVHFTFTLLSLVTLGNKAEHSTKTSGYVCQKIANVMDTAINL